EIDPTSPAVKHVTTSIATPDFSRDLAAAQKTLRRNAGDCAAHEIFISPAARSDLLFTMSENPRAAAATRENSCFRTNLPVDCHPAGGARRDRTDDLLLAKQALSQLSYGPAARDVQR